MREMQARSSVELDLETAAQMAELFSTMSDASRVRISHSAVSHHLRHLRQMRLVRARKDGRYVYYALDDEHVHDLFRCGLEHVTHG